MHAHDLATRRQEGRFVTGDSASQRSALLMMWIIARMMAIESLRCPAR